MTFVDPGDFVALQVVSETNMDNIRNDLLYLNARINPTGVMLPYVGTVAPTGWLLCDGSAVSRTTYSVLYAITGDAYGAGNGSTTFNLPDLRQRFPMGKAASGTGSTMGSVGGSKDAIVVDHNHAGNAHTHTQNAHSHGNDAHGHTSDDNPTGAHGHNVGGSSGFVVGFRSDAAANGLVSGGLERLTFTTIDSGGTHNHDITVGTSTITIHNATATNQSTTATVQNTGVSGTDANLPAYQVFTFIIKF